LKLHFKRNFLLLTILLFAIELYIGFYVKDNFIRPYGGDFLVVILIYFFLRTFWNTKLQVIAWSVLIFAYAVEIAQYFNVVGLLGLSGNRSAEIIIGTSFSWEDMLAYTLGVALVYFLDKKAVFGQERAI
jgi:hypothetical protein